MSVSLMTFKKAKTQMNFIIFFSGKDFQFEVMDNAKTFEILLKVYLLFESENCEDLLFILRCLTFAVLLLILGLTIRSLKPVS